MVQFLLIGRLLLASLDLLLLNKKHCFQRDGKYFGYILNYLRASGIPNHFSLPKDEHAIECIYLEAQYYNIQGLIEFIEQEHENWIEHLKPKNFILSNRQPFKDSKILTNQMEGKLVNLLSKTRSFKNCKLLFRASQDGFNASQFHSKCDNKGPTVTIIKTFNNCIFGGYTPLSWNTSDSFQRDNSSFLFSFIGKNEEERNVRIENQGQKDNTKSIYCGSLYGPTFGGGHDLYVDFTSNYSNLGHSYSLNGIAYATSQAQGFLAGSYHFSISELEVYELK